MALFGTFLASGLGVATGAWVARREAKRAARQHGIAALQRLILDLGRRRALDKDLQERERPGLDRVADRERARISITEARNAAIEAFALLPADMVRVEGNIVLRIAKLCNTYLEAQEVEPDYGKLLVTLSDRLSSELSDLRKTQSGP